MKSTDYKYKLQMAEKYYLNKDYNHAQMLYDDLYRVMKGSEHFEDIWYKYAYCAFYLKDYINAENLFKGFVEAFPNSPRLMKWIICGLFVFGSNLPNISWIRPIQPRPLVLCRLLSPSIPSSDKVKEANDIIEKCRAKLEEKDFEAAKLYFNLRETNAAYLKAASLTFNTLMNTYPDSQFSDEYKLYIIKSDYLYAIQSLEEKKKAQA